MDTADFSYDLPDELIAQEPAVRRDGARMLVLCRSSGRIQHCEFKDIQTHLQPGDHLVLNDTKVLPVRLRATRVDTGGAAEIMLLERSPDGSWDSLLKASNRPTPGVRFLLEDGRSIVTFLEDGDRGRCRLELADKIDVIGLFETYGEMPLPPYVRRKEQDPARREQDRKRYQTVFAHREGAVAAPTAGLHFTRENLETLRAAQVEHTMVTLHVGIGTFRPVRVLRPADHQMEEERYMVTAAAAQRINGVRASGGRLVAVGTTVVRTLETIAALDGTVPEAEGRSRLFIYPPYSFRCVDALLTNFHLPASTLLMLVCAFAGTDLVLDAYREAVQHRYRFYSYGDCMLIL
jgi:S-adenosylmethionine:tRNA ribosyltransferase-isomerase